MKFFQEFFRSLPEALLTNEKLPQWIEAVQQEERMASIIMTKKCVFLNFLFGVEALWFSVLCSNLFHFFVKWAAVFVA